MRAEWSVQLSDRTINRFQFQRQIFADGCVLITVLAASLGVYYAPADLLVVCLVRQKGKLAYKLTDPLAV